MRQEHPVHPRPHHVVAALESARVVLAIKNWSIVPGVCHIGLGVTAENTRKVLRRAGVQAECWWAQTAKELYIKLEADERSRPARPVTHVVISAPSWVQPVSFEDFSHRWPDVEFVQLNHSGLAYLSIDKFGIRNIRQVAALQLTQHNVRIAGNNPRFTAWIEAGLGAPCLLLPNLYDVDSFGDITAARRDHDPLRVGSFGASRPWKNQLVAAEAAVELGRQLGVDVELHVNSKRPDGGERMIESRGELFAGLVGARLVDVPWAPWPTFRKIVRRMDVMLSPSFDETFCVVVADGVAEGTPSVVTSAMEWCPPSWQAPQPEDPASLVRTAIGLLHDPVGAIQDGRRALKGHVVRGLQLWLNYLSGERQI